MVTASSLSQARPRRDAPGEAVARVCLLALLEALLRAFLAPLRGDARAAWADAPADFAAARAAIGRNPAAFALALRPLLALLRAACAHRATDCGAALPPRGQRRGARDIIIALAHAGPRRTRPKPLPRPARTPRRVHDPPPPRKAEPRPPHLGLTYLF